MTSQPHLEAAEAPPSEPMEWTVHPVRDRPLGGVLVLGVILVVEYALAIVWQLPVMAVIAAFAIVAATGGFLFPTDYRLDDEGVSIRFLGTERRRPWREVRRLREAREGVLLSPFRRRSLLDGPRGLFLRFGSDAGSSAQVMSELHRRLSTRDG